MSERVCPECGADRWKMKESERNYDRFHQKERDIEKLAAQNGILSYRLSVIQLEHKDHMSRMQRKIQRQARVINRLEEKLKSLNVKPYEGAKLHETSTGSEYDMHGESSV